MTIEAPSVFACFRVLAGFAFLLALFPQAALAEDANSASLSKRVQQLEEQLVDLQVVIGTLETMKPAAGTADPSFPAAPSVAGFGSSGGTSDSARLDGIETQIQALTAQMEQLSREVRAMSAGQRGSVPEAGPNYATAPQAPVATENVDATGGGYGGFGATTVTRGQEDGIGGLLSGGGEGQAFGGGPGAKQMYETAYGYMLQQEYDAAETAFRDFLKRYPNDSLAGNAQYWLGETYYLRGEFKTAATAFLEGYEKHRQNAKAPESLLKLAMSLDRLGQREAACSSYSELSAQFPNAPDHVRRRAASERRRAGC